MALAVEPSSEIMLDVPHGARLMPDDLVRLPPLESWRLERSFIQRSRVRGQDASFTLFNGHYLEMRESRRGRERKAIFNLAFLCPRPRLHRRLAASWFVATALLSISAIPAFWFGTPAIGVALVALGALAGLRALRRSRNQLVFVTNAGRAPVFALELGLVGGGETRAFAELLGERIDGAAMLLPRARERLAAEMAEHRRLLSSGAIGKRQYERARQRIFTRFSRA